jgi:gamma-glutamylcyclotransferase (GGCT)/AIG2-like uncharacterized protein YtfP
MPATFKVTSTITCPNCTFVYDLDLAVTDTVVTETDQVLIDAEFDPGPCPQCDEPLDELDEPTADDGTSYADWWAEQNAVERAWAESPEPAPHKNGVDAGARKHLVAVYGTLRAGYGNDRIWNGKPDCRSVCLDEVTDYKLVSNGAFPYAVPARGAAITVEVVEVPTSVLRSFDALEGYPVHSDRRTVITADKGLTVEMYTPANPGNYTHLETVPMDEHGRHDWALAARRRSVV